MTDLEKHSVDFFVVKDERGIAALPGWLKRRSYTRWRDTLKDKHGLPLVGLRDGEEKRGLILCTAQELLPRVVDIVRLHQLPDPALTRGL